jgi:hypothetical protein
MGGFLRPCEEGAGGVDSSNTAWERRYDDADTGGEGEVNGTVLVDEALDARGGGDSERSLAASCGRRLSTAGEDTGGVLLGDPQRWEDENGRAERVREVAMTRDNVHGLVTPARHKVVRRTSHSR